MGYECIRAVFTCDSLAAIQDALQSARPKASFVLVTGGLGPTPNDVTREAISEFTGIALKESSEVLTLIGRMLGQSPDDLRLNLRRQAKIPSEGGYLRNTRGTAVGLVFNRADCRIFALPGPPSELQPLVRDELVPFLARQYGRGTVGSSITLRFAGVGQSFLDQVIKQKVVLPADTMVSSQFEGGRVDFTFSLKGNTEGGQASLKEIERQVRQHLGVHMYSSNASSLEDEILGRLRSANRSLSIVELSSKGAVSAGLMRSPGAATTIKGAFLFQQERDVENILGFPLNSGATGSNRLWVAEAAKFVAHKMQSQVGLVVGPAHSNLDGTTGIWVGVHGLGSEPKVFELASGKASEIADRNLGALVLLRFLKLMDGESP